MSLSTSEKRDLFDNIVSEIVSRAKPEDIFDEDELKEWAQNRDLEDVFDESDLEAWALKNGFTKEAKP